MVVAKEYEANSRKTLDLDAPLSTNVPLLSMLVLSAGPLWAQQLPPTSYLESAMDNRPAISRGETEVLKALWRIEKGSVGEIHAEVVADKEMDYSTVQTYVRRLEAKGYLSAQRVGRNKVYRSALRKTQVVGEAIEEFVDRMFDGQLLPMVRHLVDTREVTSQEIDDLMKLVKQLQREQGDVSQ